MLRKRYTYLDKYNFVNILFFCSRIFRALSAATIYRLHRTWWRNHRRNAFFRLKEIEASGKEKLSSPRAINVWLSMIGHHSKGWVAATRLAGGRGVTRFNSDLISGHRCMRRLLSLPMSPFHARVIFFTFLLGLSSPPANDSSRYSSAGRRHFGATQLPPTFSSYVEGECTHARIRARTHARAQVQSVHHACIDDDVRGICTWRYARRRSARCIRCRDEEGESDSSPLESARTHAKSRGRWKVSSTSYSERGE